MSETVEETLLSPTWRLRVGDDPHFADPDMDDTDWSEMRPGQSKHESTWKPFQSVWYRAHIRSAHNLALFLLNFRSPEQVFVNGKIVDQWGKLGPGQGRITDFRRVISVPDEALQGGTLSIAIRTDVGASKIQPFGADTILVLGPAFVIDTEKSLLLFRYFTSNAVQMVVEVFVLLLALSLALVMRSEREYVTLVGLLLVFFVNDGLFTYGNVANLQLTPQWALVYCLLPLENIMLVELVRMMLRVRRPVTVKTSTGLPAQSPSLCG